MNNSQGYPTTLSMMIHDVAELGYFPTDIKQCAEFLKGSALEKGSTVTLTLRNKVVTMLRENNAPRQF